MADAEDPKRLRPTNPAAGQPLPRLWKAEPEPEDEGPPRRDRRSRRDREEAEAEAAKAAEAPKPKSKSKSSDKKTPRNPDSPRAKGKGVLVEETPELDTQETRARVRMAIGALVALVAIGGVVVVYRQFFGAPPEDLSEVIDEGAGMKGGATVATAPSNPGANPQVEQEAVNALSNARQLAKNGKIKEATAALERITKSYPKTKTADQAKAALERPKQQLPLFVDDGVVVATTPTEKKPAPAENPPPTVVVAADTPNATISPAMPKDATVQLPVNTGESPKAPSEGSAASRGKVPTKPLPSGFHIEPDSGVHTSGWPYQIVSDRDGAVMVLVPGDTFTLGRNDGTPDEGPAHQVKLSTYYIDQHEVTNRQYELYLKETGRKRSTKAAAKDAPKTRTEEDPVTNVSMLEAKAYCDWAGKSLPTEAQWEAAARSTDSRLYPWGSSEPTWSKPRVPNQIDPVNTYPLDQSPYGPIDMAGNAWEWTTDWFCLLYTSDAADD